jgi:autotransporter-associated beta strand protein
MMLAGVLSASGAIVNWDANGVAAGTGGTGVWDTVSPRWENGTAIWSNTTPDSAVFGSASGTVTLGEAIIASSITVNAANYLIDLNGSNLTVNGSTGGAVAWTITNTSGTIATYTSGGFGSSSNPTLSGNMNVVYTGGSYTGSPTWNFTGTLSLLGAVANTFTSNHNGNGLGSAAGLIQLGGATTLTFNTASGQFRTVTRNLEILGNGTLISVSGVKTVTLTGNLLGSGDFKMSGSQGMLILAGENSGFTGLYTGTSAGWFVVAKSDTAFGVEGDPLKPISITSASGIGFMGDADGSINVGAKNLTISGGVHGDGIGDVHNFSGSNSYAGNIAMSNIINFGADADSSLLLKGIVSGSRPFQKVGAGTIILGAANTYGASATGVTDIKQGTLRLDFNQATAPLVDIINNGNPSNTSASNLVLSGGILEVQGKTGATNSQRFKNSATAGFTINAGASAVRAIQNGATSLSVNFGQLQTRNIGGTVDLTLPTAGSFDTSTGTADTILTNLGVAFATTADAAGNPGIDWAAKNTANTSIVAGSSVTNFYTANGASSLAGNADMSAATVTTLGSSPTLTSLRFNTVGARTIDATGRTLGTGGILITSNVGNNISTITGGILRGAADRDLVVIQNNTAGKLTIGSTLDNSGTSSSLTKSGGGTLELTAGNTYTGPTTVTEGVLKLSHASALPGGVATAGGTGNLILKGGVIGLTSDSGSFTRGPWHRRGPGAIHRQRRIRRLRGRLNRQHWRRRRRPYLERDGRNGKHRILPAEQLQPDPGCHRRRRDAGLPKRHCRRFDFCRHEPDHSGRERLRRGGRQNQRRHQRRGRSHQDRGRHAGTQQRRESLPRANHRFGGHDARLGFAYWICWRACRCSEWRRLWRHRFRPQPVGHRGWRRWPPRRRWSDRYGRPLSLGRRDIVRQLDHQAHTGRDRCPLCFDADQRNVDVRYRSGLLVHRCGRRARRLR